MVALFLERVSAKITCRFPPRRLILLWLAQQAKKCSTCTKRSLILDVLKPKPPFSMMTILPALLWAKIQCTNTFCRHIDIRKYFVRELVLAGIPNSCLCAHTNFEWWMTPTSRACRTGIRQALTDNDYTCSFCCSSPTLLRELIFSAEFESCLYLCIFCWIILMSSFFLASDVRQGLSWVFPASLFRICFFFIFFGRGDVLGGGLRPCSATHFLGGVGVPCITALPLGRLLHCCVASWACSKRRGI